MAIENQKNDGFGDVAQLGERRLCKPEVEGSIPFVSIEPIDLSFEFLVRGLDWEFKL